MRLYARSAATRDAGVAFAREQLPAMLAKLPGSKAGTIVGVCDMAAALKDAWIIFESVPEDLELKKNISSRSMRSLTPTPSWRVTPHPTRRAPLPTA